MVNAPLYSPATYETKSAKGRTGSDICGGELFKTSKVIAVIPQASQPASHSLDTPRLNMAQERCDMPPVTLEEMWPCKAIIVL